MQIKIEEIKTKLITCGLKVTPQRMAILEAIYKLNNHPTAENIIDYIRNFHPSIAVGTVYKVLETLVENKLIQKVKTEKDVMRYDGIMDHHHHIYFTDSEIIEDYKDDELDKLLEKYFQKKGIRNFTIDEIKLQIKGRHLK